MHYDDTGRIKRRQGTKEKYILKNIANIITSGRIVCSIALLFCPVFSTEFIILYLIAGFTDMIDGTVARKTNSVSEFGSRLDTAADFIFILICSVKLFPVLELKAWLWWWIGVIAVIKVGNAIMGYVLQKKFVAVHTILNKIMGGLLFIFPITLSYVDLKYSAPVLCAAATIVAVWEGVVIKRMGEAG